MKTVEPYSPVPGSAVRDTAAVLFLAGICAVFFEPVLFAGKTVFYRDLTSLVYPMKHFLHRSIQEGHLPLWNPFAFQGTPYLAALYPGALYPPNLFFLAPDFTSAFNRFYVFHFFLLAVGVYGLTRCWKISVAGSLCASVTALLSGFFLSAIGTNTYFLAVVWLPAVFWCFQKYLNERKARWFIGAVICLASQVLAGSPEVNVMTAALLLLHSMVFITGPGKLREAGHRLVAFTALNVTALGLAAPQVVPTFALIRESTRGAGLDFAHHAARSMQPGSLLRILLPRDHKNFLDHVPPEHFLFLQDFYMGLAALLALAGGILFIRRREFWFWSGMFLAGVFFALGSNNSWYEFFYRRLPLMDLFRFPEKFYFICAVSLVFLTGWFADALFDRERAGTPRGRGFLIAVTVFLVLEIWMASLGLPDGRPLAASGLLALFALVYGLFDAKKLNTGAAKFLFLVLILVDLAGKNYPLVPMIDRGFLQDTPELARRILDRTANADPYRVYSGRILGDVTHTTVPANASKLDRQRIARERLVPFRGMVYGIEYPNGMYGVSLDLKDPWLWYEEFRNASPERRMIILQRSNVRYWIADGRIPRSVDAGVSRLAGGRIGEFRDYLPRAFLSGRARFGEGPELLRTYYDPAFDPRSTVLVGEPVTWSMRPDFSGRVEWIDTRTDRVTLRTRQNGEGFLVLLDSWFPGWRVTVDGEPGRILRANYFYRAVQLKPGLHTVEFRFVPAGWGAGWMVFAITLAVLITGLLIPRREKRSGGNARLPGPERSPFSAGHQQMVAGAPGKEGF